MYDFCAIVVLPREWESYHRKQMVLALAEVLGRSGVVICVNRPLDLIVSPAKRQVGYKWRNRFSQERENLLVFRPVLPVHELIANHFDVTAVANSYFLAWQIRRFIRQQQITSRRWVLWLNDPVHWPLPRLLKMDSVYEAYDEYCLDPNGNPRPEVEHWEQNLLRRVNWVFVTSDRLLESKSKFHSSVYRINNGLNYASFEREARGNEPADLTTVPGVKAVYVGNFRNWIDAELLQDVVSASPHISFVLIGPVEANMRQVLEELQKKPNVFYLGEKPHDIIPRYIQACDVGILPMRVNKFMENVNPYKLYEYMALGKPVVSTALPEVIRVKEHGVTIALNVAEFSAALQGISEDIPQVSSENIRKKFAQEHDWRRILPGLLTVIGHSDGGASARVARPTWQHDNAVSWDEHRTSCAPRLP